MLLLLLLDWMGPIQSNGMEWDWIGNSGTNILNIVFGRLVRHFQEASFTLGPSLERPSLASSGISGSAPALITNEDDGGGGGDLDQKRTQE